jgi:hypothetical protein
MINLLANNIALNMKVMKFDHCVNPSEEET